MRFVDFQVMTFFVGKRPLEERGRCILGCQKFSNEAEATKGTVRSAFRHYGAELKHVYGDRCMAR